MADGRAAMPAWGKTHPDPLIWDMVAFVRRLPGMSPAVDAASKIWVPIRPKLAAASNI